MSDGLFVTGTGTEVGKTIVASVLARTLSARGRQIRAFKPALSGLDELAPGERADHELLRIAADSPQTDAEIAPYRFGPALSPHLAAEVAGQAIDPAALLDAAGRAAADADLLICEGVGGLMVPLTPGYLVRDFARDLGFPAIVVAAPGLGTINHTLLTLEALRAVGIEARAVVLNPWPDQPGRLEVSNRKTIAALGDVAVHVLERIDVSEPSTWPPLEL